MPDTKDIGEVEEKTYEIKHFEWRIADYFIIHPSESNDDIMYRSPCFVFRNTAWQLCLWPNWNEQVFVSLCNSGKLEDSVVCYFGLKKSDGNIEKLISKVLKKDDSNKRVKLLIKRCELLRRKSEFTPSNILTVSCTMKLFSEIPHPALPFALEEAEPMKLIRLDKLSESFKDLLNNEETCDVILEVRNKKYKAHKAVLIARSNVFAAIFKYDTLENQTGVITITDCDVDSFHEFLKYLYCGKLGELSFRRAVDLYYTSDKYDIEELKAFCIESLMQCLAVENICEVITFADKYDELELFASALDFFGENAFKIFLTSEWDDLMKNKYHVARRLLKQVSKKKLEK